MGHLARHLAPRALALGLDRASGRLTQLARHGIEVGHQLAHLVGALTGQLDVEVTRGHAPRACRQEGQRTGNAVGGVDRAHQHEHQRQQVRRHQHAAADGHLLVEAVLVVEQGDADGRARVARRVEHGFVAEPHGTPRVVGVLLQQAPLLEDRSPVHLGGQAIGQQVRSQEAGPARGLDHAFRVVEHGVVARLRRPALERRRVCAFVKLPTQALELATHAREVRAEARVETTLETRARIPRTGQAEQHERDDGDDEVRDEDAVVQLRPEAPQAHDEGKQGGDGREADAQQDHARERQHGLAEAGTGAPDGVHAAA